MTLADFELARIGIRNRQEVVEVFPFGFPQRFLQGHIDGLAAGRLLVGIFFLGRAVEDAGAAAGAVFRGDLNGELHPANSLPLASALLKVFGAFSRYFGIVGLDADGRVRADQRALAALNANVRFPDGNMHGDVAFFVFGGCRSGICRPRASC